MRVRKNGKVIRLTESDLTKIVKRIIKEYEDYTPHYDIQSKDCSGSRRASNVYLDGETIVIRYCRGNESEIPYLKEKGQLLLNREYGLPHPDYYDDYEDDDFTYF